MRSEDGMNKIEFLSVYDTPMELVREPDGDVLLRIYASEAKRDIQAEIYIDPSELMAYLRRI